MTVLPVLPQVLRVVSVVAHNLNRPTVQICCLSSLLGAAAVKRVVLCPLLCFNLMFVYTGLMSHLVACMIHLSAMNVEYPWVLEGALHLVIT